jgi:PKD repeat protein
MRRGCWLLVLLLVVALGGMCSAAGAEQLVELWHNPLGGFEAIADAGDGSVWVINQASQEVLRVAPGTEGELTIQARAATTEGAECLAANTADGSVWIGDRWWPQVVHMAADGTELARVEGMGRPAALSVDPTDDSCWVLAGDPGQVLHLAADGTELSRAGGLGDYLHSLAAAPGLDSCWVAMSGPNQVIRLEEQPDHTLSVAATYTASVGLDRVAVDASDLTVWVANCCIGTVLHLHEGIDHSVALMAASPEHPAQPAALWVDPSNHTCWVTDGSGDRVVQLDPAGGDLMASLVGLRWPSGVSGDAATSTLWVLSYDVGALTRATTAGTSLRTDFVVNRPCAVSVGNGSVWVYGQNGQAMRVADDGTVLATAEGDYRGNAAAADPADNSCWLVDCCYQRVLHVDAEGDLLSETAMPGGARGLALDAADGSCWVVNPDGDSVSKLAQTDGAVVQTVPVAGPTEVAVDPVDGTVWVISSDTETLTHFRRNPDASITTLSTTICPDWESLAVDPVDGSCVVGLWELQGLVRVRDTEEGSEVTRTPLPYCCIEGISVDPVDQSIWFVGNALEGIVHLSADGTELSRADFTQRQWLDALALDQSDRSVWVVGRDWSRVTHVAVAVEADFSAAVTSGAAPLEVSFTDLSGGDPTSWSWDFGDGDTSTDQNPSHTYSDPGFYTVSLTAASASGSGSVTKTDYIAVGFTDTPTDHWAFLEIIACADAGIVTGYTGGNYDPTGQVSRAQMAVFMARAVAGGDAAVPPGPDTPSFSDVPDDYWAYKHVEYCVDVGIATGYPGNTYHPDEAVSRGQMAVYVARAAATPMGDAGVPDYTGTPTFTDVTSDNDWAWCLKYVEYCADQGIVQGYGDEYRPANAVTRDQMAVYIQRAFELPMPERGE